MATTPEDQVVDGVGRLFVEFMSEVERIEPVSEIRFFYRHFRALLAAGAQTIGASMEGVRADYVRVLLGHDRYALDRLFKCMAEKLQADATLSSHWQSVTRSTHAPPQGETRKPGSHRGPP